jgi:hypothetical protein
MTDPAAPVPAAAPAAPVPGKVLGIVGLILAIVWPFQVIGLILSIVANIQSKNAGVKNTPAKAGIIIAIILLVLTVVFWVIFGVIAAASGNYTCTVNGVAC